MIRHGVACVLALALGAVTATQTWSQAAPASAPASATSWTSWGNGGRVNNYSPADQINAANINQVIPVWERRLTGQRGGWENTPLVVGGLLYGLDLQGRVFALDPETGKEAWAFATGLRGTNRSVSYWPGDAGHKPRILVAITDRIYALDPETGAPVAGFGGPQGYLSIREGFAPAGVAYGMTSPPTIYKNLMITGAATQEFGSKGPPADPRAYDVVTGKLVWRFNIVPQPGQPNFGGFGEAGWRGRSGPSTWGVFSVDEETGSVFIPVGQPADNYVGIDRPGDNLYSDSVLALDAATGKYRWHYQVVHHDLWDFDLAAPPVLVDLNVKGKRVPALVEATKQGMIFILDRRTGKPVFGVEERPVPASTIPGEQVSPTQPFPIKPPPLVRHSFDRSDITTITPEANRYCTDTWNRMGFKPASIYTPPAAGVPLVYTPANAGGAGGVWGGVSVDPRSNTLFVNVSQVASYVLVTPDDGKKQGGGPPTAGYRTEDAFTKFMDPNGFPCIQPPWGEMIAINGNTGDILWRSPLGKAEVYGDLGAHTGMLSYGGTLATGGGLVFVGGTNMACSQCKYDDPVVRAYDARTGMQVWSGRLPASSKSNLMTFVGKSGRQYIVATSSGRPGVDPTMVAFALPRPGEKPVDIRPATPWPSVLNRPAAAAAAPVTIARVQDLPDGPGKADVGAVCTVCHSLATVTATRGDAAGWTATVATMKARGAQMDAATEGRIVAYLAAHFAPTARVARVGPNGEVE
jgi:glucose dehydrogenase